MKTLGTAFLVLCLLAVLPTLALSQMGHCGTGGGMSGGVMEHGQSMGSGMGQDHEMGSGMDHASMGQGSMNGGQIPMSQSQMQSGALRMLEQRTGMSAADLQQTYASSGARNFGQFTSAMVVSQNLGLDSNKVLSGMKDHSLEQTLQNMGVSHYVATTQIKSAQREIKRANTNDKS